jgi:HSP20 family protein
MSIQRWDPWRDLISLREAMNSLLEESFVRPRAGTPATGGMPIDLRETDGAYIVETIVPGAKPEQVDISVLGDTLRISAEITDVGERQGETWLIRERRFGRFERALTLPMQVKAEQASAEFTDGVLRITLPKAEAARPRSIPVRGSAGATDQLTGEQPQEIEVEAHGQTTTADQPTPTQG